jgi:16S rRNA (cytidine1402-2'-O)-methyltransferase
MTKIMGILTLIPTPIDDEGLIDSRSLNLLTEAQKDVNSLFVIEDLKPGRRRWLSWGLDRARVESFILYNEHTKVAVVPELIQKLKEGFNIYLMSDGGLPAFCDPGKDLVDLCHQNKIRVTAAPFDNSIALALALSGFNHAQFYFRGFLPVKAELRAPAIAEIVKSKQTTILMDTPYRLKKILEELQDFPREIFLAMNLNSASELLLRGSVASIRASLTLEKAEFILVLS